VITFKAKLLLLFNLSEYLIDKQASRKAVLDRLTEKKE
jgi:hypothetical protein